MSKDLAMTMDELEGESAELLPARETLCVSKWHAHGGNSYSYSSTNIQQIDGNTVQNGLLNISLLNGDLNSLL
jgi:hypothetical protein